MTGKSHLALQERTLPPATEWMPESAGWTFVCVRQGEGYLMRSPAPQQVGTGDVVITSKAAPVPLRASQLGELRVQYFQVHPELLTGVLSAIERHHLDRNENGTNRAVRHYPAAHVFAQQVANLSVQTDVGENLQVRFQMLQLAATILTEGLPVRTTVQNTILTAQERFEQIMRQMPEAKLLDHSPTDLARMCGCSLRHFSRLYKGRFGHSLISKKIELRLQKAQQLLADTDDKIIDVAMDSGFQHVGLFTTMFRKRFGMTPSNWRKHARKDAARKAEKVHQHRKAATSHGA